MPLLVLGSVIVATLVGYSLGYNTRPLPAVRLTPRPDSAPAPSASKGEDVRRIRELEAELSTAKQDIARLTNRVLLLEPLVAPVQENPQQKKPEGEANSLRLSAHYLRTWVTDNGLDRLKDVGREDRPDSLIKSLCVEAKRDSDLAGKLWRLYEDEEVSEGLRQRLLCYLAYEGNPRAREAVVMLLAEGHYPMDLIGIAKLSQDEAERHRATLSTATADVALHPSLRWAAARNLSMVDPRGAVDGFLTGFDRLDEAGRLDRVKNLRSLKGLAATPAAEYIDDAARRIAASDPSKQVREWAKHITPR